MDREARIRIPFSNLSTGRHTYQFAVGDDFTAGMELPLIDGAVADVSVAADKQSETQMTLHIGIQGYIRMHCDRCLNPCRQEVTLEEHLLVEVRESSDAEDRDELIAVGPDTQYIALDGWLMETLHLQRPIQVRCEDAMDAESCDPEVLRHLGMDAQTQNDSAPIDPRWDALRKLHNPNNN